MAYDIQEAIRQVDSIPLVKESIPELTDLANGSNPNIPGYLALGKLHQITNLAENAQTAKPPQGTIKDKTTQAAGLMALMGGRSQQAAQQSQMQQAQQPGAVPQGTPEPQMQEEAAPEDMMFAAEGGIMRADIDPDMFRFDGGGIVAFANDLDKKKQQVKDKEKDDEKSSTVGRFLKDLLAPISNTARDVYAAGQAFGTEPGLFEQLTESQRAAKERAAEEIRNPNIKTVMDSYLRPDQTVRNNEQNRLRASYNQQYREGNTANSPYEGKPLISPEMQQMMAAQAQPPAAPPKQPRPPMGGINDGRTQIPGGNAPALDPVVPQPLPENKFLTATEGFINQKPEVFDEAKETAKINARNEAAGIGTYAKVMRDEQAKMRGQFDASRPSMAEGIVGALRAYSRPGAMAGDVGGELTAQMSKERDARMQFEQDQFKVTEAIEKLEEARRTGNVDKIAAAETAVKKANADLRNHQMTAAASAANTLGKAQEGSLDRAQQLVLEKNKNAIEYAKLAVEKAKVAAMGKDSDIMQVMKKVEALEKAGKPDEATKVLELWGQANSMKVGAKYDGKSTAPTQVEISKELNAAYKLKNSLDFLLLSNKNAKQADKAAAQARIDATTKEVMDRLTGGTPKGGGGGAKPTFEEFMAKAKPANPNTSDAELKAYYQKNYGG